MIEQVASCQSSLKHSIQVILMRMSSSDFLYLAMFLYPATQKVAGYYVIPSELFECPAGHQCFVTGLYLSSFWPIVFKVCMDIDIREEWFQIANGLNLYIKKKQQSYGPWLI